MCRAVLWPKDPHRVQMHTTESWLKRCEAHDIRTAIPGDAYVGVGEDKSSVAIGGTSESPQSGA